MTDNFNVVVIHNRDDALEWIKSLPEQSAAVMACLHQTIHEIDEDHVKCGGCDEIIERAKDAGAYFLLLPKEAGTGEDCAWYSGGFCWVCCLLNPGEGLLSLIASTVMPGGGQIGETYYHRVGKA